MSIAQREKIAHDMAHNISQQMTYNRLDLGSDEEKE
jgi:hypothetical protein